MAARFRSARGVVMLEFGVFAPLVLTAILFASDFLHVLCCEQQLEIACRALCDIESHLKPGLRKNDATDSNFKSYKAGASLHDVSGCPGQPGNLIVMHYLEDAIGKDSNVQMLRKYDQGTHGIYPRGYYYNQSGIMHEVVNFFSDDGFTNLVKDKLGDAVGTVMSIIGKVLSGALDVLTFRTHRYVKDIFPTDKVVAVSLSAEVMPTSGLTGLFGRAATLTSSNASVIPMYTRDWNTKDGSRRKRFYYHMPSFDTSPLAPQTYGRRMSKVFKQWIGE